MASTTDLLTTSEAARAIGVSSERVRQLARADRLPATDTPLGRLYSSIAVGALVSEREAAQRARARARQVGAAAAGRKR